jgi:prepilin-type N-terminal cleavage/methylation domain-containing protein
MSCISFIRRIARKTSRRGFTLVELLVVIGIIAILAGVALGPITSGIEKAKESSGLQTVRSINLLMFSYANDNSQTYATGGHSEDVCNILLNQKYASDPTIFAITTSKKYPSSSSTAPYSLLSGNVDFDFTAVSSSAGVTSAATDQLPIVFTTGLSGVTYPTSTTITAPTLNNSSTSPAPFALNGVAVAYKSNSALFLKGTIATSSTATVNNFFSSTYNDTGSYTQLTP